MGKEINNDDDFMRKLGTLKWHGETPSWLKADLLSRPEAVNDLDAKDLQKEVEMLKVEKSDLAVNIINKI